MLPLAAGTLAIARLTSCCLCWSVKKGIRKGNFVLKTDTHMHVDHTTFLVWLPGSCPWFMTFQNVKALHPL